MKDTRKLSLAVAIGCLLTFAHGSVAFAERNILVEIFTSEGCSDCPDADRLLAHLISAQPYPGIHIIGLEEHVDYWNGKWIDSYSLPTVTNRQYAYSNHFNDQSVYTPEMVVDGDAHFNGSDGDSAQQAIIRASRLPASEAAVPVKISQKVSGGVATVVVSIPHVPNVAGQKIDIMLAVTENDIHSHITDGENKGRTLSHGSVVRFITDIGAVGEGASPISFATTVNLQPSWRSHPLSVVAFLQSPTNLKIYGSAIQAL